MVLPHPMASLVLHPVAVSVVLGEASEASYPGIRRSVAMSPVSLQEDNMSDQYIWIPGDPQVRKALSMTIIVDVTAEDIRENGVGKMLRKPIEIAAKRMFGKQDTWNAFTGLWFQWTEANGEKVSWEYRCTEEAFNDFARNPRPCGIRFVRVK